MATEYTFTRTADSVTFHMSLGELIFEATLKGDLKRLAEVEHAALKGVSTAMTELLQPQDATEPVAETQDASVEAAVAAETQA